MCLVSFSSCQSNWLFGFCECHQSVLLPSFTQSLQSGESNKCLEGKNVHLEVEASKKSKRKRWALTGYLEDIEGFRKSNIWRKTHIEFDLVLIIADRIVDLPQSERTPPGLSIQQNLLHSTHQQLTLTSKIHTSFRKKKKLIICYLVLDSIGSKIALHCRKYKRSHAIIDLAQVIKRWNFIPMQFYYGESLQ